MNQTVYCITYYISKKTDCHISVVRPAPISSGESEKNSWLTAAAAIYSSRNRDGVQIYLFLETWLHMQFMTQSHQPFDISSCLFFKPLWAFPCSTHLPEALDLALSTCRIQMRVRWSSTCIKINQDMIPHLLPHGLFEHISNRSPAWSCMQLACGIRARCLWPTQWEVDRSCGKPSPK